MGLPEILKKELGDEQYGKVGKKIQQEISKEFVPKKDFNDKLDIIKSLESDKTLLEKDKTDSESKIKDFEAKQNEKEEANLSEMELLKKNLQTLTDNLKSEKTERLKVDKAYQDEKLVSSIKGKLLDAEVKPKYVDMVLGKFKTVEADKFDAELETFAENNKELFGKDKLEGKKPEGGFDNKSEFYTKEEVESMSDKQVVDNLEKIQKSQDKWQ